MHRVGMPELFCLPTTVDGELLIALSELAETQSGVIRRDQSLAVGLSKNVIEAMLAARRWQARGQIVLVMHNGELTYRQQLWAAVLNAGFPSGLAARTAATDQGLVGWRPECIEILVPKGTLIPPGLGLPVKVHESRRFTAEDLHVGRALPQVRVERALVDAAAWSRSPRTACGVLAAGVQQRLTTASRLRDELLEAGKIRHRRLLLAAVTDIEGGAQAVSEMDFLKFCRRNGMPRPEMQAVRKDGSGRRRYLDATFRRHDGKLIRVEIDGALHLVVLTYWSDMYRGNELVIGRESVLRFPSFVIYANDPQAVRQLRRALDLSLSQRPIAS
jgi:hypothetical protein